MKWTEITLDVNEDFLGTVFVFFCIILFSLYVSFTTRVQVLGEDEVGYWRTAKEIYEHRFTGFTFDGQPMTAPLMLPILSAMLFPIFGEQLFVLKAISTIFGLLAVISMYYAVKKVKGIMPAILTTSLMMAIMLFSHFLLIAYVETMIVFFSSFIILMMTKERTLRNAVILGTAIALALFAKNSAMLLFPVVFLYFIWAKEHKEHKRFILVAMLIPIAIWSLFIVHNLMVYRIPAIFMLDDIWFRIFGNPYPATSLPEFKSVARVVLPDLVPNIGAIPMLFMCIGFFYAYNETEKITKISFFAIAIFILASAFYSFSYEVRYVAIIFPFLVFMVSGYWNGIKEYTQKINKKWVFYLVTLVLTAYFIRESFNTVQATSNMQRWQPQYIEGLYWIRNNTSPDATIFTAYGGSVYYYADRNYTWVTSKFPEIMRSNDTQTIYNDLLEQKVDYIYIWQGIIGADYVLPASNLYGIFSYNFLNEIQNDPMHFTQVYANEIGVIFKVNNLVNETIVNETGA